MATTIARVLKIPVPLLISLAKEYSTFINVLTTTTPPPNHSTTTIDPTQVPQVPKDPATEVFLLMDGENMHLREIDDMKKIVLGIEKTLQNGGFPTSNIKYYVYGNDEDKVNVRIPYLQGIKDAGFTFIRTPATKQGADGIMKSDVEKYIETHVPSYITVMTGDRHFKKELDLAREKGFKTLVIGRADRMHRGLKEHLWADWIALRDAKEKGVECNPPTPKA